jgi:Fe-S-cluster formation regulator IscX/YfhJ
MAQDDDPNHMRFTDADREIVNQLVFDPTCEPSYELLKACLVWSDERPTEISNDG